MSNFISKLVLQTAQNKSVTELLSNQIIQLDTSSKQDDSAALKLFDTSSCEADKIWEGDIVVHIHAGKTTSELKVLEYKIPFVSYRDIMWTT